MTAKKWLKTPKGYVTMAMIILFACRLNWV